MEISIAVNCSLTMRRSPAHIFHLYINVKVHTREYPKFQSFFANHHKIPQKIILIFLLFYVYESNLKRRSFFIAFYHYLCCISCIFLIYVIAKEKQWLLFNTLML
jgi:hypothetical protein